jgi:hypothetical protein
MHAHSSRTHGMISSFLMYVFVTIHVDFSKSEERVKFVFVLLLERKETCFLESLLEITLIQS